MKMRDILQNKVGLYINLKYTNFFCEILRNLKNIQEDEEKNKPYETIFQKYFKEMNNYELTVEEKIYNNFKKLINSIFTKDTCLGHIYSKLEIAYLKYKAKIKRQKCKLIAIKYNKLVDYLIRFYIKLCLKEVRLLKGEEIFKIGIEKMKTKKGKFIRQKTVIQNNEESEEEEIDTKDKMINLFIGKFDFKKLTEQTQKLNVKRSEFVNGYLFSSVDDINNEDTKLQTFQAPTQHYKEKKIKREKELKYKIHAAIIKSANKKESKEKKRENVKNLFKYKIKSSRTRIHLDNNKKHDYKTFQFDKSSSSLFNSNKNDKISLINIYKKDNKRNIISLNKKKNNINFSSSENRSNNKMFKTVNFFPNLNYSYQKNKLCLKKKPKEMSFFSNDEFYY